MPKFIYTILISLGILASMLVFIINFTNPDNLWVRFLVPILVFLTLSLFLPLLYILLVFAIYKLRKLRLPDLLEIYKKLFKKCLRITFIVSVFYLLKVYEVINNYTFLGLLLSYVLLVIFYPLIKGKKSPKIKKVY